MKQKMFPRVPLHNKISMLDFYFQVKEPISCKNPILGQNGQNFWPNFGLKKEFYYAKGPS